MAKPEWAIDRDWAEAIFDELVGDAWHDDTVYIGNAAQLKLLEHILKVDTEDFSEDIYNTIKQMKSQSEKER